MIEKHIIDGSVYFKIKDIVDYIGFSKGIYDRLIKNINNDIILKNYVIKDFVNTNGGRQKSTLMIFDKLYMLLCKISTCSFSNDEQIKRYNVLLEYSSGLKNYISFDNRPIYSYESNMRDEIYNNGKLQDIRIIDKEKEYDFGRIDLFGIDINGLKCCIELKKYTSYNYLKDQLLKYVESMEFDRVIYVGYEIDSELIDFCKNNKIEVLTYKRSIEYI